MYTCAYILKFIAITLHLNSALQTFFLRYIILAGREGSDTKDNENVYNGKKYKLVGRKAIRELMCYCRIRHC